MIFVNRLHPGRGLGLSKNLQKKSIVLGQVYSCDFPCKQTSPPQPLNEPEILQISINFYLYRQKVCDLLQHGVKYFRKYQYEAIWILNELFFFVIQSVIIRTHSSIWSRPCHDVENKEAPRCVLRCTFRVRRECPFPSASCTFECQQRWGQRRDRRRQSGIFKSITI